MSVSSRIRTLRLSLTPLRTADARAFVRAFHYQSIARQTETLPKPLTLESARAWIADQPWHGAGGQRYAVRRWGRFIGMVGLGGSPLTLGYMFAPHAQGRGFATEAARALLRHSFQTKSITAVLAAVFDDNQASRRVLEKLGFAAVDENWCITEHRPEGAKRLIYRITPEALT